MGRLLALAGVVGAVLTAATVSRGPADTLRAVSAETYRDLLHRAWSEHVEMRDGRIVVYDAFLDRVLSAPPHDVGVECSQMGTGVAVNGKPVYLVGGLAAGDYAVKPAPSADVSALRRAVCGDLHDLLREAAH